MKTNEQMVKQLVISKEQTLNTVTKYIVNTIKAKAIYNKGGWKEVNENFTEKERFNHNLSISTTAICMKLRQNNEHINLPIQANMQDIANMVNKTLNISAVEYYVDRKNHALKIIL